MEDQNEEWAVEEYTSKENKGKVGWILNKGLTLGKNILVTGMVISSAPLVIPPLVVFSAIGVAVSIPSGVYLASYACTQKLMNTLLPFPTHPPPDLLEYGTVTRMNIEEEELIKEGGGYSWLEDDNDIQREQEKEMEDIRRSVETRIELVDEENEDFEEGKAIAADDYEQDRVRMYSQAADADLNFISEEKGCKEDVAASDHLIVNEVKPMDEIDEIRVEGDKDENERMPLLDESRHEEPIMVQGMVVDVLDEENGGEMIGVTDIVMEEDGGQERAKGIFEEDLVKETGRLPEKIRDVGKFTTGSAEKDKQIVDKLQGGEDENEGYTRNDEEIGIPVDDKIFDHEIGLTKPYEISKEAIAERRNSEEVPEVCQDQVITNHEDIEGTTTEISTAKDVNGDEVRFGDIPEEELIKETRGLLEKIRDEGKDDKVTEDRQESREGEDRRSICNVDQEVGAPLDNSFNGEFGSGTPLGSTEGDTGKRNIVGTSKEGEEMQEMKYEGDSSNAYRTSEAEKLIGGISDSAVVSSMREEDTMPLLNSEASLQGGTEEDKILDVISLKTEVKIVMFSSADAREVADESGIDSFDGQNTSGDQDSYAVHATTEAHVGDENLDFAELPISFTADESMDAAVSPEKEVSVPSDERQKVREQIDTLRAIVGYKATPHTTYMEELKALYIFTGVEPPKSLNNSSDLAEVNDKLHFLMSIIGVK